MSRSLTFATTLVLLALAGAVGHSQERSKAKPKLPEVAVKRGECAIFLPERDERHDVARLLRADQFLDCERDGFPKNLAPPWKEQDEAEKKLSNACDFFLSGSAKQYPHVTQASLRLAWDRCQISVMTVIFDDLVEGPGKAAN